MITCLGLAPALDITYGVASVEAGRIHRPDWVVELPGGKALNVARALATLGRAVHAIAPLGGPVGESLASSLAAEGVSVSVVPVSGTRRCITAMDAANGSATEFYEPALPLSAEAWRGLAEAVDAVADGWLAVSGSVPATSTAELGDVLAAAARRGVRLAVDLRGEALRAVLGRTPVAVTKVNRAEAAELFGDASALELAGRLQAAGAVVAVVTDGIAGASAASAGGCWRAAPGVRGAYPVGSGDSFLAGLLAALSRDDSLEQALALATAAAAANTLVPGAGRFTASDVSEILPGVRVEPA